MKNVTLSVPEDVLAKARAAARKRGKSLNVLIRDYLEELGGSNARRARALRELKKLWAEGGGHSGGRKIRREEAYEGRV